MVRRMKDGEEGGRRAYTMHCDGSKQVGIASCFLRNGRQPPGGRPVSVRAPQALYCCRVGASCSACWPSSLIEVDTSQPKRSVLRAAEQ